MNELLYPPVGTELSTLLKKVNPDQETPYFKILVGTSSGGEIITRYNPGRTEFSPQVQDIIDREWEKVIVRNPNAFPGSMVRLDRLGFQEDGELLFELSDTDYCQYRGTVALTEAQRVEAGFELANPLCAALIVRSEQAYSGRGGILFSQRSVDLAHRSGALEFPAGNVTPEHINSKGEIDPIGTAVRELGQEQAIKPAELRNLRWLGVIYEKHLDAASVLIAQGDLDIDPEEVSRRAEDRDGEGRSIWIEDDFEKIADMTTRYCVMSLPLVGAGLYLYWKQNMPANAQEYLGMLRRRQIFESTLSDTQLGELEELSQV